MKKRTRNRFLALLLTLALLLPCWPETVLATSSYGRTVGKNVLVYKEASPDYGAWFYAEQGTPGMVLIKQAGQGGTYYKVQMYDPYAVTPTIVVGFILESQFTLMTDAEAAAFEAAGGLANPAANAITAQTAAAALSTSALLSEVRWAEVLSAALAGGAFLKGLLGPASGDPKQPYHLGHFFFVADPDAFLGEEIFRKTCGQILRDLRASEKAPGHDRIYTAGEKEYLAFLERKDKGVPVGDAVQKDLTTVRDWYELPYRFLFEE